MKARVGARVEAEASALHTQRQQEEEPPTPPESYMLDGRDRRLMSRALRLDARRMDEQAKTACSPNFAASYTKQAAEIRALRDRVLGRKGGQEDLQAGLLRVEYALGLAEMAVVMHRVGVEAGTICPHLSLANEIDSLTVQVLRVGEPSKMPVHEGVRNIVWLALDNSRLKAAQTQLEL